MTTLPPTTIPDNYTGRCAEGRFPASYEPDAPCVTTDPCIDGTTLWTVTPCTVGCGQLTVVTDVWIDRLPVTLCQPCVLDALTAEGEHLGQYWEIET